MKTELLFSEKQIQLAVKLVGSQITKDYFNQPLVIISIADGGLMFAMDLIRNIKTPLEYYTCICKSYGAENQAGKLQIKYFPQCDLNNKHVIIVDDIKDTGNTLSALKSTIINNYDTLSVEYCVLIENINKKNDIIPKYVALRSEGQWVIGYGLDNQFFDRNLPYIIYRTDIGDNNE